MVRVWLYPLHLAKIILPPGYAHLAAILKIGFYGNANNYPFMLARAFRRAGHEVNFFVLSRFKLNRPEFRYPDISLPYPAWIIDISRRPRFRWLLPIGRKHIYDVLNRCDLVILNEEGCALSGSIQPAHVALITGSDLEVFADFRQAAALLPNLTPWAWANARLRRLLAFSLLYPLLVRPQRRGLARASLAIYFPIGMVPVADQALGELGLFGERRIFLQMTDLELIAERPAPRHAQVRIFCPTRLTWVPEPESGLTDLDYKGSDIMVRGIALFLRKTGRRLDVHLVRKGRHVAETERLARAEGIESQITWHDEMSQHEVIAACGEADIIFEQLGKSGVSMAGLDAMAIGRPVIANGRPEIVEPLIGEASPICQATTPEQVCAQLERLVVDPGLRQAVGAASRRYVEKHFSADSAAQNILKRLSLATGAK